MFGALSFLNVGLTELTGIAPLVATHEVPPQVSAKVAATPIPATTEEPAKWSTFEATAYIALCDTGCSGFTATGLDVRNTVTYENKRVIAVDPAVIALGSTVEVRLADGSTFGAIALDVGGGIEGAEIDVLMADIDDAWDFGKQAVQIRILKETVINDGN